MKSMHIVHSRPRRPSLLRSAATPLLLALLFALCALSVEGQAPLPYTYTVESVIASSGSSFEMGIFLDSSGGTDIGAFSFSACFDDAYLSAQSITFGADLATIRFGGPPEIFISDIGTGFFNVGCTIDALSLAAIPPAANTEVVRATLLAAPVPIVTPVGLCAAGSPPVAVVVVESGTGVQTPALAVTGAVTIADLFGQYSLEGLGAPVMGSTFDATVVLDATNPFEGFRFGLGHDAVQVTPLSVTVPGTLAALNGGNGPDQYLVDLAPAAGTGITVDCLFSTSLNITLPGGATDVADVVYEAALLPTACSDAQFVFRDDLGVALEIDLPNATELAIGNDTAVAIASVPLAPPTGGVTLTVDTVSAVPGELVSVPVLLDADVEVQAFSFSATHSSPTYVLTAIEPGLALLAVGCNVGPSFFDAQIDSGGTIFGSVFAAIDIDLALPTYVLPAAEDLEIARLIYQVPSTLGVDDVDVTLVDGIGVPPVALEVTADYQAFVPATVAGGIVLGGLFERGACNSDGSINIADAVVLLLFLFPVTSPIVLTCEDACDTNDDGVLNIADAIFLLNALFGSQVLPDPIQCGEDPTSGDLLGCDPFSGC